MNPLDLRVRALLDAGEHADAATAALRALGPEVLGYLRSVLKDETDASDAFSLFAEQLWRGLPGFEGNSSLRTWAYRVAWSAAGRITRDPYRAWRERLSTGAASRIADDIRASAVAAQGERSALALLRAQLSPEEQTLLVLRLDRELGWNEVAEVLAADGEPADPAALRKRFERLKGKLERLAREAGLLS